MPPFRQVALLALLACLFPAAPVQAADRPAQVAILSTLHQLHEEVPGYTYEDLSRAIERLAPDVLCVEVTAERLAERAPEKTKREYPAAVYPLLDAHHWRVYPLEPSGPRASVIVLPYLAANKAFAESSPARSEAFGRYGEGLYAGLRAYWTSPARANDAVTDQNMRAKHALQEAFIGEGERDGWEAWNRHFLEVVARAAAENPGKRIVVTVGAEHGYWLREHVSELPGVELLDTAALLAQGDH